MYSDVMHIVAETFLNPGEPSSASRRVRALPCQGIAADVRIECSRAMRSAYPLGQKFLLDVKWKYINGAKDCLYSNYRDEWNPLSDAQAKKALAGKT